MGESDRVAILGASAKPERYLHKAQVMIAAKRHRVFPVHLRASLLGAVLVARSGRSGRSGGARAALALVALLATVAACSPDSGAPPSPPGFPEPPLPDSASLLLVTLDTFRADAAGCGGSPIGRTPYLDRISRTGLQFETGLTTCPLTLPSHATMMTGLAPPAHGIRTNGITRLPGDLPTLAGALAEREFATGAFLAAFALVERFGLGRGFDVYDDDVGGFEDVGAFQMARRPGDEVSEAAAAWADALPVGRRRFEWVHLFDAHQPYDAPAPLLAASGRVPYLADIAEADSYLGAVLRRRDLAGESSWVVVLGDHGESVGDHREETHGLFIYAATMRVPAVIWPAPRGERPGLRRETFRVVDLPATAFDLLGLAPDEAPGVGVSALTGNPGPAYMESFYSRLHHGWSELRAIRDGRWKYIEAPEAELYDLESDPGETDNLHDEYPEEVARLADLLSDYADAERAGDRVDLDAESREALESLGYVTSTVETAEETELVDPKRMVRVNELIMSAMRVWGDGRGDGAHHFLSRALSIDPRNREVHKNIAMLNAEAGRHDVAVDWYLRCLSLPPFEDDHFPRAELARSYLALGRPEDAVGHLEIVVLNDPDDASAWNNLGVARIGLGEREAARTAWERALRIDPGFEAAQKSLERTHRQ